MSNQPGCSSSSGKRKMSESEDEETRKQLLKAARLVNHEFTNDEEEKEIVMSEGVAAAMDQLRAAPKQEVMSHDQLETMFKVFFPNDTKEYDSDDSINSESDNIPADVRAKESEDMLKTFANMKEGMKKEKEVLDEMYAEDTPERRQNRRRKIREAKMGDATKKEKELAERKFQEDQSRQTRKAEFDHQVFLEQETKTMKYMTRSVFSQLLEALAEVMPDNADVPREYKDTVVNNHGRCLEFVKKDEFKARIKFHSVKAAFFRGEMETEEFVLLSVKKILLERKVRAVLNHPKFGFDFSTKDAVLVLSRLFGRETDVKDDGNSVAPLAVNIGDLTWAAAWHARHVVPGFEANKELKEFYARRFDQV